MIKFLNKIFQKDAPAYQVPVVIVESTTGQFSYHLAKRSDPYHAFCGKLSMPTSLKMASWNVHSHLNESYCRECAERMNIYLDGLTDRV